MENQIIALDSLIASYVEKEETPETPIIENLFAKSREAFLLSIEIYNKPTITYRVEGFSFFICNAWELLLKAHLISTLGEHSIYYPDSPDRSFSLEKCLKTIFTNENDPLRINLEKIIELRNTSTHFVTQEYESLYIPFFQACVINFAEKYTEFSGTDISNYINLSFLTLVVSKNQLTEHELLSKYGPNVFDSFMAKKNELNNLLTTISNDKLAIGIGLDIKITKKEDEADLTIKIDPNATSNGVIVKEIKDVNTYYPYNQKRALTEINKRLLKGGIEYKLTSFAFGILANYFKLYQQVKYCYLVHIDSGQPRKIYSLALIEFITDEIRKDNKIVDKIRSMQ